MNISKIFLAFFADGVGDFCPGSVYSANDKTMDRKKSIEESISFVSRYYRADAFDRRRMLAEITSERTRRGFWLRPLNVAASIGAAVLVAAACVIAYHIYNDDGNQAPAPSIEKSEIKAVTPAVAKSERIDFSDAPLSDVAAQIEKVYGVTIINVPQTEYRLTLSYEGTAADLIQTINDLLGTDLQIGDSESQAKDADLQNDNLE